MPRRSGTLRGPALIGTVEYGSETEPYCRSRSGRPDPSPVPRGERRRRPRRVRDVSRVETLARRRGDPTRPEAEWSPGVLGRGRRRRTARSPEPVTRALCLNDSRSREETVASLEREGFAVHDVRDHREDLLAMRDRIADRVDYEGILGRLGDRGQRLLDGIDELEAAIETGRVGYVSLVATREESGQD